MDVYTYFPSNVYREERPEWVEHTLKVSEKYYASAQNGNPVAQTGQMVNDPDVKFLVDYLLAAADMILRQQGYAVDKYELYVESLWGQDVKCTGGTNIHVHKNSQLCGWFFLETPEDGSYPVYFDPRMNKQMVELDYIQGKELTNASAHVHFDNVKPGTILMANSWIQHQLTQSNSQAQTKSVHFVISHREKLCNTY